VWLAARVRLLACTKRTARRHSATGAKICGIAKTPFSRLAREAKNLRGLGRPIG
jgi:hypothetical protein